MIRRLVQNLSLLLVATLLAAIVWVVAVNEENPIEVKAFPRVLPIEVISPADGLRLVADVTTEVAVTVRAPAQIWTTLTSNKVHVIADLSALDVGQHTIPLRGVVDHPDAEVVGLSPNEIQVELERIVSRTLPIQVSVIGEPARGYQSADPNLSASSVIITGPEAQVNAVSEIAVEVDLDGRKEPLEQTLALRPTDSDGRFIAGLTLEPSALRVNVLIEQVRGFREVAVNARIEGQVAPGYRVTNISVAPPIVTVFSENPVQVAELPGFIETEPLDISDATDDISARLTLTLPDGVSLVDLQAVVVQVNVAAIEGSLTLQQEVTVTGLGPGLSATLSPSTVDVILSGPLPVLDHLQPDEVTVIADLFDLSSGTHQVLLTVVVEPEGVTADIILPAAIQVEIVRGVRTPTAAP